MAKKPKKETSKRVSSIAGRIMAAPDPFDDPKMRLAMAAALIEADTTIPEDAEDMPTHEIIAARLLDALRPCFDTYIKDVKALAASALAQDETK